MTFYDYIILLQNGYLLAPILSEIISSYNASMAMDDLSMIDDDDDGFKVKRNKDKTCWKINMA